MRIAVVAGVLAGALLLSLPGGAARAETEALVERLDAALSAPALRGARIAALVVDRDDGKVIYARHPDRAMIPASNLKVLTAMAALHAFGPAYRFDTEVLADEALDADGAVDRLYVRGHGDPALTSEDFWRLAADLRRLGLRHVRKGIVLDDSIFDGQRWHPSWGRTSARAYHAPVGGLTVNYGAFAVTVAAGEQAGAPVEGRVDPAVPFLRLTNRARTGPSRARRTLVVDRRAAADVEEVLVTGVAPAGGDPRTLHRSVLDPARYAGAVLRMQLEAVGIAVEGPTQVGYVPPQAELLLDFEGHALSEVVRRFLKYSNNSIGEALVKSMAVRAYGAPGTWDQGVVALRAELEAAGVPVDGIRLVDGSGLSYENRVTPRVLVDALQRSSRSFRFGPELLAALPIAASDGTLEERAEEAAGLARAKTGLLTRVTCLTGMAAMPTGRPVVFSILVNGFRSSAKSAMDAVDGFLAALVAADQDRVAASP
jgi:D-alanyl-D-alanine carboxypeptidase/D-alanyl-D-alanine-endopeptidase (penicillin-binding protein 4)